MSPFVKRLQKEAMDLAKETKVFIHQRSLQNKLNYQAPKQLTQVIEENASLTQCLMILIALVHVRLPNSMYLKTADLSLPQPLLSDLEHSLNNIKKVDDDLIKKILIFADRVLRVSQIKVTKDGLIQN